MAAIVSECDVSYSDVFGDSDDDSEFSGFGADDLGGVDSDDDIADVPVPVDDALDVADVDMASVSDSDSSVRSNVSDSDTDSSDDDEWSRDLHSFQARPFSGPPPGPTTVMDAAKTVLDFFMLLFPLSLIELLVRETNRYAQQKRAANPNLRRWTPVSVKDIKKFLGLRVFMSLDARPTLRKYWSKRTVWKCFVPRILTRSRFEEISSNFHANDRTQHLPKEHPNHDKLHLIRPVLDEVLANCLQQYNPHQNSSIDEAMIAFRGRLGFRQYMPKKPTKYGVKVWMRADPTNGYCNEFQVYTGRVNVDVVERGLAARVVLDLSERLRGGHYVLNMDNFFSSLELFERLKREGLYARGTVRVNRRGWPRQLLSEVRLRSQGDCAAAQKGTLSAFSWRDKRVVNLLSTADDPTVETTVSRKQRDGTKKEVPCPSTLLHYNNNMNGVDHADQMRMEYPSGRMSRRWWVYLFWFLFDVAVSNAFILMKESVAHQRVTRAGHPKPLTLLEFRETLSEQLMEIDQPNDDRDAHVSGEGDRRRRCQGCKMDGRRCETKTFCRKCDVVMCKKSFPRYHRWR